MSNGPEDLLQRSATHKMFLAENTERIADVLKGAQATADLARLMGATEALLFVYQRLATEGQTGAAAVVGEVLAELMNL